MIWECNLFNKMNFKFFRCVEMFSHLDQVYAYIQHATCISRINEMFGIETVITVRRYIARQ